MGDKADNVPIPSDYEKIQKLLNDVLRDKQKYPQSVLACELFEAKTGQKREYLVGANEALYPCKGEGMPQNVYTSE